MTLFTILDLSNRKMTGCHSTSPSPVAAMKPRVRLACPAPCWWEHSPQAVHSFHWQFLRSQRSLIKNSCDTLLLVHWKWTQLWTWAHVWEKKTLHFLCCWALRSMTTCTTHFLMAGRCWGYHQAMDDVMRQGTWSRRCRAGCCKPLLPGIKFQGHRSSEQKATRWVGTKKTTEHIPFQ